MDLGTHWPGMLQWSRGVIAAEIPLLQPVECQREPETNASGPA